MYSRDGNRQEIVGILSGGQPRTNKSKEHDCRSFDAVSVSIYQVSTSIGEEVDFSVSAFEKSNRISKPPHKPASGLDSIAGRR